MHTTINPTNIKNYHVQITHYRYNPEKGLVWPDQPHGQKGGATIATLIHKDTDVSRTGFSYCSPKDSFNRKIGRNEAIRRAYLLSEMKDMSKANNILEENIRVHTLMQEQGF